MRQYGFSALELLLVCAIAAALLLVAIPAALGTKLASASTGTLVVDAIVAKAQAIAATSGKGSALQFTATAQGTAIRMYSGRPTAPGALTQAAPDTLTSASISEASLGTPPFAIFFDSSGHASAMSGVLDPVNAIVSDPGCPASGHVLLTVFDARVSVSRTLPCAR